MNAYVIVVVGAASVGSPSLRMKLGNALAFFGQVR